MIELSEKTVGIWFMAISETADWLCGLTEVEADKSYRIDYRFRYHKDDKIFESQDEKNWYKAEITSTRSYAISSIRSVAQGMKASGAIGEIDELLMDKGGVKQFREALFNKPWVFTRMERKDRP